MALRWSLPYDIGMTGGDIARRILAHLQAHCAGQYWTPDPQHLDAACGAGHKELPEQIREGRYMYRPALPGSFTGGLLDGLGRGDPSSRLARLIRGLRFFAAPMPGMRSDDLRDLEWVLIEPGAVRPGA